MSDTFIDPSHAAVTLTCRDGLWGAARVSAAPLRVELELRALLRFVPRGHMVPETSGRPHDAPPASVGTSGPLRVSFVGYSHPAPPPQWPCPSPLQARLVVARGGDKLVDELLCLVGRAGPPAPLAVTYHHEVDGPGARGLHGDETVVLQGLNRWRPRLAMRLPDLCAHAALHGCGPGAPVTVPLAAHGLELDGERERCTVVWGGSLALAPDVVTTRLALRAGMSWSQAVPVRLDPQRAG